MNRNKRLLDRHAHRNARGRRHTTALVIACAIVCALAGLPAHATVTNTWNVNAAGYWNTVGNWSGPTVPKLQGDVANITNAVSAPRTVTIDTAVALGGLRVGGLTNAFTVQTGTGGSLTFDNGGSGNALLQQLAGSAKSTVSSMMTLTSDLDLVNSAAGAVYFNISGPFVGSKDIHVNRTTGAGVPYMTATSPSFVGNFKIYSGRLMFAADAFGSTGSGVRTITLYNGAGLRDNMGSPATLASNRQIVLGAGGGVLALNGKTLNLNASSQLAGSESLSISVENGTLGIGGANNDFTGPVAIGSASLTTALALGAAGSLDYSPLLALIGTASSLDVSAKTSGYNVPAGQVVAGIGSVRGRINVSAAGAKIHPGTYTLPGPVTNPGKLTITNGLTMASGGAYLWDLKTLKDDATGVAGTDFGKLDVVAGAVSLSGGVITLSFVGTAGTSGPNSGNEFWKTEHTWTILTATSAPSGTLAVSNGVYTDGEFWTQVSGNTLQLVYGRPIRATTILVR